LHLRPLQQFRDFLADSLPRRVFKDELMTDSQKLLADYATHGSETAFRELVSRYLDLVFSTALRSVGGDEHREQDVAQTVFLDLARQAPKLSDDSMLGGWLHRDTCFVAAKLIRGERRRQIRERQAAEMNALNRADTSLAQIAPVLDEAINELADEDRKAILLRFYERMDLRSVGEALGGSENAAQKRLSRALEKLELLLKRRGITSTATALSGVLSANAVQTAPIGLASCISTAALAGGGLSASTAIAATKMIAMTTFQKAAVTVTIAVLASIGLHEAHQSSRLHEAVRALLQQQASLAEQIQRLQRERDAATNRLASLTEDNIRLGRDMRELLKLRSEVSRLRNQSHDLAQAGPASTESDEIDVLAKQHARKAQLLKQLLAKMPEKSIPELQYIGPQDWMNRASPADLETDAGIAKVLSELRHDAKEVFAALGIIPALRAYAAANSGQLPTDISQLKPYSIVRMSDDVLQRYQVMKTGSVNDLHPGDVLIAEKAPVDEQNDTLFAFGLNTWSWHGVGTNSGQTGSGGANP
jgi:RNA polymerase sigma factor (sigma-70 family)